MSIDNGDHARSIMQRILRLQEEVDALKADIRGVYAEAKAHGYDKAAMGDAIRIIRKREKDAAGFEERSAIVDLYLAAFDQSSHVHAGARAPEVSRDANPEDLTAAQNEGAAGASPDQAERERAVGEGVIHVTAQRSEFVTQAGAGEGGPAPADPAPAADARPIFSSRESKPLGPHCKNPDRCGGYGSKHCYQCKPSEAA